MLHFVTLFDILFLPQGLALHLSMERHVKEYTLWILCVDDEVYQALQTLNLSNVKLLQLSRLETDELLRIKPTRSKGEYCWTLTPFAPSFVFDAGSDIEHVTYIDADMWFRKHPKPIFDEFFNSEKSILITDHSYAPEYDQSSTSGQYCVQFIIFKRNSSEFIRKNWEELCIDWCFNRFEDGKFGDQKYLDLWPIKYSEHIHILKNIELILAPWNATRFPYGKSVLWHFHGLRLTENKEYNINGYKIPDATIKNIYEPYCMDMNRALQILSLNKIKIQSQIFFKKNHLRSIAKLIKFKFTRFTSYEFNIKSKLDS